MAHLHDVRLAVQRENVGRTPGRLRQVDGGDLSSTTGHLGCILEQCSGALSLVQITPDTGLSLDEPYYAKIYVITTRLRESKD